jgi:uncharacterized DUF497 family protein
MMTVEWDPAKARSNSNKHGVNFADAAVALEDEFALTVEDRVARGEERFVTVCRDPGGRVIVIAYTFRGEALRIISARTATKRERMAYEVDQ